MVDFLKDFVDVHSLISFAVGLVVAGLFLYKFFTFLIRKEIRIFKNLNRKIYLSSAGTGNALQAERELIKQNNLFSLHEHVLDYTDLKTIDTLDKFSFLVIAYSKDFEYYANIIERVKRDNIPLVVYAPPGEISKVHMELLTGYAYFDMCNTSSRLLTTIASLAMVVPYEKK